MNLLYKLSNYFIIFTVSLILVACNNSDIPLNNTNTPSQTQAVTISSVTPVEGSTNSIYTVVTLNTQAPHNINSNAIPNDFITITDPNGNRIPGEYSTGSSTITFTPSVTLDTSTIYTVTIDPTAINDINFNIQSQYQNFNITTKDASQALFISPSGDDNSDGLTSQTPFKTFAHAFSNMTAGDELILLDGNYSVASGTGGINWDSSTYPNSAQVPSGNSAASPTLIRAQIPGNVFIEVPLFIGRSSQKHSYIKIQGITFTSGESKLFNTSYVTVKDCGFGDGLTVGTSDHNNGNSFNLIEDVWIWAAQRRIIATNYRADNNVWRRVIIRGDGCNSANCTGSGNPNVGFTVYNSRDVSVQNMFIVDRILGGGSSYADFATAQHYGSTPSDADRLGRNEWLGSGSINTEDHALQFEADSVIPNDPTWTIKNFIAIGAPKYGVNFGGAGNIYNGGPTPNLLENITVSQTGTATGDGIRVANKPGYSLTTLRNSISHNAGLYAFNSGVTPSYVATFTPNSGEYAQDVCSVGCYNDTDMMFETALQYPLKPSSTSPLSGAGYNNNNIGATIINRYGIDGTHVGDTDFNTLTTTPLWPWPNEARIKTEMCQTLTTPRGFCSGNTRLDGTQAVTLSSYIWESLGNPMPISVYGY